VRVVAGALHRDGRLRLSVGTIFEARSPAPGVVLYICAVPSMKKGDTVANIGVVAASPP